MNPGQVSHLPGEHTNREWKQVRTRREVRRGKEKKIQPSSQVTIAQIVRGRPKASFHFTVLQPDFQVMLARWSFGPLGGGGGFVMQPGREREAEK